MKVAFLVSLLALVGAVAALKDLSTYDNHDSISPEEIWEENLAEEAGVIRLTADLYMEKVYRQAKGEKAWYICLVSEGLRTSYWQSTHAMKSLFFLQRHHTDKAVFAFVESTNELLRETFENDGVPQCLYVVDG